MSVFVSSHLLSEIEMMCDRVAIISRGEVLAVGTVDELVQRHGQLRRFGNSSSPMRARGCWRASGTCASWPRTSIGSTKACPA